MDKYLKCKSCGAIVKVVKPCNCPNCGIVCCGKPMEEYVPNDKTEIKELNELTCAHCGAKVKVIKPCTCPDCGISCCGEQMK